MSRCDICGTIHGPFRNDHCHYHIRSRGTLCHRCNILMGNVDRALPVLVEWVSGEIITEYRKRCPECSAESLDETIRKYEANRQAGINTLTSKRPVAALPKRDVRIRLRKRMGISQAELADALRVSRQTIVAWERNTDPTGANRENYAGILESWRKLLSTRKAS